MWQTDRQTDRPLCLVGNNRRSARWRSQILLLSTATTFIYWSSRLDRSDQLQQSAAIFSCKTRRVAVYVETLYNSLEESFPTGVLDSWHNCLLIYWRTSCLVHAFMPSITCLRVSDASVICRVTYFQLPIQSALPRIDPVSRYFIGWSGRDLAT